jgi:glycosyltransferase involved in cell wall biosynthesis
MLNALDRKKNYSAIHVHSLPDFLVLITFLQKRKGTKIVLDLHEAMPEIFAARFKKDMNSFMLRFPMLMERISHGFADHLITVNETIKQLLIKRGVPGKKITVIMNSPDEKLRLNRDTSKFRSKLHLDDKFKLVFIGGINYERNLEVILKAMPEVKKEIPNFYFIIFGHMYGHKGVSYKDELKSLARKLGIEDSVYIGGKLDPEEVSSYLELSDFGVVSYLLNPLTDVAVPNKVFEYIALNKPVIVCRLKALHSLFGDEALLYYQAENHHDLAQKMIWLYKNRDNISDMKENAKNVYDKCKWNVMKERIYRMHNDLNRSNY